MSTEKSDTCESSIRINIERMGWGVRWNDIFLLARERLDCIFVFVWWRTRYKMVCWRDGDTGCILYRVIMEQTIYSQLICFIKTITGGFRTDIRCGVAVVYLLLIKVYMMMLLNYSTYRDVYKYWCWILCISFLLLCALFGDIIV